MLTQPKRILITGAGGTPSSNFVRSLRETPRPNYLIGVDCNPYYLQRAETDEKHLVPRANEPDYLSVLQAIIQETGAELIYSQPDQEILVISRHREDLGLRTFLPAHRSIEICQDKFESYRLWQQAGLKVPATWLISSESDLIQAFAQFGSPVWLRAINSPGGGKGSFAAQNIGTARTWIDFCQGWGRFTAAECLAPESTTWTSLWREGELIVAQGRKRLYWEFSDRAPSGVTGITGTGVTISDPLVDETALKAIQAIDPCPHGIFAVDLTYDKGGVPNPTEINIGRFFTTHWFFTRAGLNLPDLFVRLAFGEPLPALPKKINPLPPDLAWIRGMDFAPVLTTVSAIEDSIQAFQQRRLRLVA